MSLRDFERCTPFEFQSVFDAWSRRVERSEHAEWDRARYMCMCILQPYSKKKLRPTDIVEFPWEKKPESLPEVLSKEEQEARYQAALKRYGIETTE